MISRLSYISSIAVVGLLALVSSYGAKTTRKEPTTKAAEVSNADVAVPAQKSVFRVDKNFRDPFYPKSSKPIKVDATPAPVTSTDVVSMLRSGFQGIMGVGENRLAVINNAIIETGKIVAVPIGHPTSGKSVRVRVMEILKDSVVLEVEGQKQPITLSPPESK